MALVAPIGTGRLLERVRVIELEWPRSKYGVRLGWPWLGLGNALEDYARPDLVLNNESELTARCGYSPQSLRCNSADHRSCFHYLAVMEREGTTVIDPSLDDLGSGQILWTRQLEAARCSAASIIGTEYGAGFLRRGLGLDAGHIEVIPPPVIPRARGGRDDSTTILYNHRLYAHYGTEEAMLALERVCHRTRSSRRRDRPDSGPL